MKKVIAFFILLGTLFVSQYSCTKKEAAQKPEIVQSSCDSLHVSYYWVIKKMILETNCAIEDCHVKGFASGDFTTYLGLKEKVDNDLLEKRVLEDKNMPPANSQGPKFLSDLDLQRIDCWIKAGAPNN